MATDNRTAGASSAPDSSNLRSQLTEAFAHADEAAAERVQHLQWVQQARVSQLSRTAAELKAVYGANDADVKRAEAALSAAKAVNSHLAVVHQQMTTPEPDVAPGGWVLHGRVFTAERKPVQGFTVFLADDAKAFQEEYGFSYTDAGGYFLLRYQGSGTASGEKSTTARQAQLPELFIEVTDLKARPVYLSATPFQPVTGAAAYQNIFLSEAARPIGEPPAGARRAAVPKRKPKR
jgi:hypothetical protein